MENLEFLDLPEQLTPEERLFTLIDTSIALPSRHVIADIRKGPGATDSLLDDLRLSFSGVSDVSRVIGVNQELAQSSQENEIYDDSSRLPKVVVHFVGARLDDNDGRPVKTGVIYDNLQDERYRYVLIPGSLREIMSGETDTGDSAGAIEVRFKHTDCARHQKITTTVVDHPVYPEQGARDSYSSSIVLGDEAEMIVPFAESVLEQAIDNAKAAFEQAQAGRSSRLARRIGKILDFRHSA